MSDLYSFESAPFNWYSIIGVFIFCDIFVQVVTSRLTVHALALEHLFHLIFLISRWHARRLVEVYRYTTGSN